jgi:hypothetical protein
MAARCCSANCDLRCPHIQHDVAIRREASWTSRMSYVMVWPCSEVFLSEEVTYTGTSDIFLLINISLELNAV